MANFEQLSGPAKPSGLSRNRARIEMTVEKETFPFCIFAYLQKGLILAVAWGQSPLSWLSVMAASCTAENIS